MAEIADLGIAERPRRRKLKLDPLWLALPGLAFLALFLVLPTAQMLSLSFLDKITGALTLSAFSRIWNGGPYLAVLWTTYSVALSTTALCVGLGYPLAYWLSRKPPRQQRIAGNGLHSGVGQRGAKLVFKFGANAGAAVDGQDHDVLEWRLARIIRIHPAEF